MLVTIIAFPIHSISVKASIMESFNSEELVMEESSEVLDVEVEFKEETEIGEISEGIKEEIYNNKSNEDPKLFLEETISQNEISNEEYVEPIIEINDIVQASSDFEVSNGVLIRYHGTAENVVIPGNLGITTIASSAFSARGYDENTTLKSVVIPEGVVSIQDRENYGEYLTAFKNCVNLTTVSLPSTLTSIGNAAFMYCRSLKNIDISKVSYIGEYAFHDCVSLPSVNFSNNLKKINDYAFNRCLSLTSVTIPSGVISIGKGAFNNCEKLAQVYIPSGVTSIGENAFAYCFKLTEINIPSGITNISKGMFDGCKSLTSISIPVGVKSIGAIAFRSCEKLKNIEIPETVITIGEWAFWECKGLLEIGIPNAVKELNSAMFYGCTSLKKVKLSENISYLSSSLFQECTSLTSIIIPSSVTKIGGGVFNNCSNLKTVKFLGDAPTVEWEYTDVFGDATEDLKVYYLAHRKGFGLSGVWQGRTAMVYPVDTVKINAFVTRLYEKILNRKATSSEINYYGDYLIAQYISGADAGKGFVLSPEFINRKLSNTQYIEILYQTFLGRKSDAAGLKYWNEMLSNGVSRLYVYKGVAESSEYTAICKSYGILRGNVELSEPRDQNLNLTKFISRCYQKALGRTAEADGLNYYAQEILLKRVTPVQASQNFIFSPEFKNKNLSNTDYVKVLYRTFMGREFDQGGLNYHLNRMKNGTSREEILLGFANSPEFKNIMSGFGL